MLRKKSNNPDRHPSSLKCGTFLVDGTEYTLRDVMKVLKSHERAEKQKYKTCSRCKAQFISNSRVNICKTSLSAAHNDYTKSPNISVNAQVIGYASTPYLCGISVNSSCGVGRSITLCDDCADSFVSWFTDSSVQCQPNDNNSLHRCQGCGELFTSGLLKGDILMCENCFYDCP